MQDSLPGHSLFLVNFCTWSSRFILRSLGVNIPARLWNVPGQLAISVVTTAAGCLREVSVNDETSLVQKYVTFPVNKLAFLKLNIKMMHTILVLPQSVCRKT